MIASLVQTDWLDGADGPSRFGRPCRRRCKPRSLPVKAQKGVVRIGNGVHFGGSIAKLRQAFRSDWSSSRPSAATSFKFAIATLTARVAALNWSVAEQSAKRKRLLGSTE